MAKKKRFGLSVPLILVIGLGVSALFWAIYGFKMLLRYWLGAVMFGTVTMLMVKFLWKAYGKRKVRIR